MERILAPILRNDRGTAVRNLQDGVILLLTAAARENGGANSHALIDDLAAEQRDGVYGDVTMEAVARFQREHRATFGLPLVTGEQVDDPTAGGMNRLLQQLGAFVEAATSNDFFITGRVEFEDGSAGAGLRVDVFDRDLGRHRVLLGDPEHPVVTASNGVFPAIRYHVSDFAAGEGRTGLNADLVFEITAADDQSPREIASLYRRQAIGDATHETLVPDLVLGFEAAQVEDVRIVITGRPSERGLAEYERLMLALEPMLLDGATPAEFDQERARDFDFAARETGWNRDLIETMTLSWRLARAASREPQLLAETFYGLLRHGPPTEVAPLASTLSELLDQDPRWASKLEDSVALRIVDGDPAQHLARLREVNAAAAMRAGDGRRASIGDVLAHARIPEEDRRALLGAYQAHVGSIEDFWREVVPRRLGWDAPRIRTVQTTLQLAELLGYDLPLMTRLQDGGVVSPRELVTFDRRTWIDLVTQVGPSPDAPGATAGDRINCTVDAITAVVHATFPTESMAHLALTSRDPKLAAARDLLARFFERESAADNGEGFDVTASPVTTYLETHGKRVFGELQSADQALLTSQLQRLQRVFRLGVDRAQTEALLALDLDSAFHITRFSPEHFVAEFGERLGGADRASLTYGRAEKIAGTVLYLYTDLWQGIHGVQPMAIKAASQPDKISTLKELPTYRALFGGAQLCDCGHCQSFYSPAAYFVDLLHMLDRPALGALNPAEVLFRRRPDLAHIQLTCDNTNTLIPYVDLVAEVLEGFVANGAPTPFNIPPGAPNRLLPAASKEELRVNPVYLTTASSTFADQAYAALQEAVFPLTLPLNLPLETTRAYLDHLGTNRAELMTLFDRDPGPEALMARAAEILLMSPEEFELISGAKFGGASALRPGTAAEFFGLSMTGDPTKLFNHAAPEIVRNDALPDERVALIRSLQNILSLASPAPIPPTEWDVFGAATEAAVNAYLKKHGLPQNGRTDGAFWGALEADGMQSLSVMVCPVLMLLDRTGLTYAELLDLVKTRFLNPTLQGEGDLDYLARLGVPAADVRAWIQAGLQAIPAPIQTVLVAAGEDPVAFTTWVKRRTRAIVINTGFESPCDLDRATLMHLDGTLLLPEELVTLSRFIRLWRKLGWTVDELDHALEPGSLQSNSVFQTVLLLANIKQLRDRLNAPIAELVTLWQTVPTHGGSAVYDRLFRNRAAQLIDPILELNRERTELKAAESATPPVLSDHIGSILAAFRMSAPDLATVREAVGLEDDPALPLASRPRLDLAALSALYRPVALARALRFSVRELLALKDLSGLDPFVRPDRVPRGDALTFVDLVEKVRTSRVAVGMLDYLCRAVPQTPGLPASQRGAYSRTLAAILDGLQAIALEEPIQDDSTGEELTARLTPLVGPDDARATTALIYGRDVYTASLTGLPDSFPIPAAVSGRLAYDAARKQLALRGPMTATDRALLLAAPGVPAGVQAAYGRAVKTLDAQPRLFVARALGSMFSPAEAQAALIDISSLDAAGLPIFTVIDAKITAVLERRHNVLSRSLITQTLTTATNLSADTVGLLLENEAVLKAIGGVGRAVDDYQVLDGDGLDAEYFANPDLATPAVLQRVDALPGFDLQGSAPAPGVPALNFSVRWTGNLYVPATGEVTFRARCRDGIQLVVNDTVVIDEWQDQSETEFNAALRLDGGRFYPVEVRYYNKTGAALMELSWSSASIPAAIIPQLSLYTSARYESLLQLIERIHKIGLLFAPFELTARDIQRLAEHGDIALDQMPLVAPAALQPVLSAAQGMFAQWLAIFDFTNLRNRYPTSDVSLMDVPSAPTRGEAIDRFVTLTGADTDTLNAIVDGFGMRVFDPVAGTWTTAEPDLTTLVSWANISDALELARRTGARPDQLLAWARAREIKELPTGPETLWLTWTSRDEDMQDRRAENARFAQEAKNLVRARYDEDRWRVEAQLLNDLLRVRRRSALTAFVLAMPDMMRAHVSDTGRLFEFLLIDVEMDPCMETSRIKQGISSVQLFIQRVLLNLESPQVPPAGVDRARWEWTKNYRVWEANRKIFLYAESYTEEALRDNKSPIFKDLESELLQDELNDANAERAFRHYLEKLDDVAKLIVCGTCVDSDAGALHVFGRTSTAPFVFYHRQLDNKSGLSWTEGVWSPWQKLPVDVATIDDAENSGAHLLPIAWNRRLYLFWPLFEQKPDDVANAKLDEGFDPINCWHVKLAWSEYQDGRWSAKQTGVPFIVSGAFVENLHGQDFWNDVGVADPYKWRMYTPGHVNWEAFEKIDFGLGSITIKNKGTNTVPLVINDDEMLNGTKVEAAGDSVTHEHSVNGATSRSLLPAPADHYLDAQIKGSQLIIQVFARFRGTPTGQARSVVLDKISVVRNGTRSDRFERSQNDFASTGGVRKVFKRVGRFEFAANTSDLIAATSGHPLDYQSLARPQNTTNSFMRLRHFQPPGFGRLNTGLFVTAGALPMLESGSFFDVIDSDNRNGFDRRGPFFYEDGQRCYLVTRDAYTRMFDAPNVVQVRPDARATVTERTVGLATVADRQLGLAPEASLRANPWAHAALDKWAAGPGLPAALRSSGGVSETVHDKFDGTSARVQPEYTFTPHWHPYTSQFIATLNSGGLPELFTIGTESQTDVQVEFNGLIPISLTNNFELTYKPDRSQVVQPYPLETVDFDRTASYALYNWEAFFHAPLTVATAHSRAGRYEEALRWFHFVFDPMTGAGDSSAQRSWRFLPFRTADTLRIEETLDLLTYTGSDSAKLKNRANLQASIQEWVDQPFNPHLIARRRPVVYMKYVFMKYLDNLIAWADELFQRDTIESLNEATQLYVLAANLLGPRPERTPAPGAVAPETYQSLRGHLDALSNAQVDLETRLPFAQLFGPGTGTAGQLTKLPQTLYFCLPQNDQMLAYWDTIADRLFKIRHCMSTDGNVRPLALFDSPINPRFLVEAVAHGLDIGSVLKDLYAPLPRYRFSFMLQQALAMCNEVRSLGSTLLSVLEKRDAEALSMLRAGQERQMLDQVKANKKLQIDEAEQTLQALAHTQRMTRARIEYYETLIAQGLISEETDQLGSLDQSNQLQETASWIEASAQMLNLIPNVSTGTNSGTTFGGSNMGSAASAIGRSISGQAAAHSYRSSRASITGGHSRRAEDWRFQRDQAKRELSQVERQQAAARIRKEIVQADLRNHETAIEHARSIEALLRTKFTNDGLYGWMQGQLCTVYFQCYKTAYEIAKNTQRCFQYELGTDATFVRYGAWDSSVRGLLAGEQLYLQLKEMERAYFERKAGDSEIIKHVSLLQLDPLALIALKETGTCEVDIPEWLFDLDYPGHYFRRLKTVSITIPAVVGPYASVSATVTLLSSKVRDSARVVGTYGAEENYRIDHLAVEAIAASTAQNDSGRFQLDFHDGQYMPFEGAGAISRWRIDLPRKFRSWDYDTISDAVLHLKMTSRRDELLAGPALATLQTDLDATANGTLFRLFSLRHEFPSEWQRLRTDNTHMATLTIAKQRFPLLVQSGTISVSELHTVLILKEPRPTVTYKATLTPGGGTPLDLEWPGQPRRYRNGAKAQAVTIPIVARPEDSGWLLQLTAPIAAADLDRIQDILIVVRYTFVSST